MPRSRPAKPNTPVPTDPPRWCDDVVFLRLLAAMLGAGFLLSAVFAAWPGLDIRAAALFYSGDGFPLGDTAFARGLRAAYRVTVGGAFLTVAWLLLNRLARGGAGGATRVPARVWLFALGTWMLGAGLLVNALLKDHWGRARPNETTLFGGDGAFSGPFVIAGQCARNCSFVSGEGAGAAALASVVIGLFWPALRGPRDRALALAGLTVFALGVMFVRMAPGRHFLSDLLFSFVLVGLVAMVLYAALGIGAARSGLRPLDYRRDLATSFTLPRRSRR